jgi:hypothetical protein
MKRTTAIAAAFLLAAQPALAESTRYGLDADYLHDDNASRGLYDADRKADNILSLEGSAMRSMLLGSRSGAVFRAAARYTHFNTFDDLSNLALTGRAAWRIQPGLEFGSPFFEIAGNLAWLQHADSELRDGTILTLEASTGSHVTDRLRLGAGFGIDQRDGGGTAGLYDLATGRLWATLDYRFGMRNTAYARLMQVAGDHVFCSITVSGLSPVWELDTALASGLGRAADCYRLDAKTLLWDIGLNFPLSRNRALDFAFTSYTSKSDDGGLEYDGMLLRASYLYRFQ